MSKPSKNKSRFAFFAGLPLSFFFFFLPLQLPRLTFWTRWSTQVREEGEEDPINDAAEEGQQQAGDAAAGAAAAATTTNPTAEEEQSQGQKSRRNSLNFF